jgi:hypothetical protein
VFKQASETKLKKQKKETDVVNFKSVSTQPWLLSNFMVVTLEKLGDGIETLPGTCESPFLNLKKELSSGGNKKGAFASSDQVLLAKLFKVVAEVILEPLKGSDPSSKQLAVGLGKGTLGLVCKPIKGSIDLVMQATRGVSNTPTTMYIALSNMLKRNPATLDAHIDQYLCEVDGQAVYLNRQLLKH